jgi:hypothetical protein
MEVYLHPSPNKKNYKILKTDCTPIAVGHGGSSHYSTPAHGTVATAVGHDGSERTLMPSRGE